MTFTKMQTKAAIKVQLLCTDTKGIILIKLKKKL
jgi:hypothetical protein